MEAIILAGGFGTRLRDAVPDLPKPMAPVNGRPFLEYLLDYVEGQGIERVILATGYKHEVIFKYFSLRYRGVRIDYSREEEPLGTGGAVLKALELATDNKIFLLNGDTFFQINLADLARHHNQVKGHLTMALKKVDNAGRYGLVQTLNGRIVGFDEKKGSTAGYINGGVYFFNTNIFAGSALAQPFSLETDFLNKHCSNLIFQAFFSDSYFIDIGIPADYARAGREFGTYAGIRQLKRRDR